MKALELADSVEKNWSTGYRDQIIAELRRLAAVEAERDALKAEELKLHQSLAQAVLHAEQGWSRYENAKQLANGYMAELERIKALPPVAWIVEGQTMGGGVSQYLAWKKAEPDKCLLH